MSLSLTRLAYSCIHDIDNVIRFLGRQTDRDREREGERGGRMEREREKKGEREGRRERERGKEGEGEREGGREEGGRGKIGRR